MTIFLHLLLPSCLWIWIAQSHDAAFPNVTGSDHHHRHRQQGVSSSSTPNSRQTIVTQDRLIARTGHTSHSLYSQSTISYPSLSLSNSHTTYPVWLLNLIICMFAN
ncbi:hypothetical protein BJX66DRAFT_258100 [Aspergillus keveii]|uniref:Secreted protein n=1 Tax=Aspergillus keveii TaxID=714993 RepID=A0ABR4GJZ6_9EURO